MRALAKEIVAGALSAGMAQENAYFAETLEEATEILISKITAKDIVLIKASRGVKTEQIVEKLKEKFTLEKS